MNEVDKIRALLPDSAKDIKLNLQSVFQQTSLTPSQVWGTAIASAIASRNSELSKAVISDAREVIDEDVIEDAAAAATLMGMNNVYYRFRHMIGKEGYTAKPARLRMNWMAKPKGSKADFELFSLAVSAINGCELCIRSHEQVILEGGLTEDQIHDAVRVAATINAAAIAVETSDLFRKATVTANAV